MSREREWWLRVPGVLIRPRDVFLALRETDKDDVESRQEPVLLILLVAGMAAVLLTPAWGTLLDDGDRDGLVVAVLTFIAGGIYGFGGYFLIGGALYLGARGMGSLGDWRLARHVLAFACMPLALSLPLTLPVGLAAFGGDLFRSGGADAGGMGDVYLAYRLLFVAWTLALLALGIRTTYGWSWARTAGAAGLLCLFLVLFSALSAVL
jgi:hypothetical protein